jgi:hypothetical protein
MAYNVPDLQVINKLFNCFVNKILTIITLFQDEVSCNAQTDICSPNADCVKEPFAQKDICKCKEGFRGDGIICNPIGIFC